MWQYHGESHKHWWTCSPIGIRDMQMVNQNKTLMNGFKLCPNIEIVDCWDKRMVNHIKHGEWGQIEVFTNRNCVNLMVNHTNIGERFQSEVFPIKIVVAIECWIIQDTNKLVQNEMLTNRNIAVKINVSDQVFNKNL